jgi:hypothetical protein
MIFLQLVAKRFSMCKVYVCRLAAKIDYRQTFHIKEPSITITNGIKNGSPADAQRSKCSMPTGRVNRPIIGSLP